MGQSTEDRIQAVTLDLPLRMGSVNCYLVDTGVGFVLIDTGPKRGRAQLEETLDAAQCGPGDLSLIILTHGDFDHTANAAYLRDRYSSVIAMHRADLSMAWAADMFSNRRSGNALVKALARPLVPLLFGYARADRFKPELYLEDGHDLLQHGFEAQVLHTPGHSEGSVSILTGSGSLFCGDLLENVEKPALNSIMDDPQSATASIHRLESFNIGTVYPGHGAPFALKDLSSAGEQSGP